MTRKLDSRVAIITGSARGLGVELAEQFGRDGAAVLLTDINADDLPVSAERVLASGSPEVAWISQDLSKEGGAAACVELAIKKWGRIDILVNNAGGGIIRPFLEHTPDTLRQTIDRNLWTNIWCTRAVLPEMIRRSYGRIVSIGADSVHTGIAAHAAYNAAKGGVHALATGLAAEFAKDNITVNVVSPGGIATPAVTKLMSERENGPDLRRYNNARKILEQIPTGRFVEMREVAALAAFLTYPESLGITGQIYSVNGGQWML
jgi:2,3-dihydroxy-2,3-dihydro-p-cumate dehydrogenase